MTTVRLCACGCGAPTKKIPQTLTRDGYVKGEYYRYLSGHHRKTPTVQRYRYVRVGDSFRKVHRVRAENALGKPLPPEAVVHHADGSKDADAPLVICQDQGYHRLLHYRMRILRAGGNPNTDKICGRCQRVLPLTAFSKDRQLLSGRGNRCKPCKKALRPVKVSKAA